MPNQDAGAKIDGVDVAQVQKYDAIVCNRTEPERERHRRRKCRDPETACLACLFCATGAALGSHMALHTSPPGWLYSLCSCTTKHVTFISRVE